MKICMLTDAYYPSVGGVETHINALSNELARLGNKVTIITHYPLHQEKTLIPPGLHQNVEIIRIKCKTISLYGTDPVVEPSILSKLYTTLKNLHCDIVHGHTLLSLFVFMGLKAARKLGIPTVLTKHSIINQIRMLSPIAKLYLSTISHNVNSLCNAFIGVSKACIKEVPSLRIQTYYVPNGVDLKFKPYPPYVHQAVRREIKIRPDDFVIGHFGRLVKRKGISQLLDMFPHIKEISSKIKLLIIGCGPLEKYLKRFIRNNTDGNVIYLGKKTLDEMPRYFQALDIFAFPTYGEGVGLVALEALASGIPVVAYPSGGVKEVITSGVEGFLVNSKKEFIKKVMFIANHHNLRKEMGEKGASLINRKYRWHRIAKELLNIYKDILPPCI